MTDGGPAFPQLLAERMPYGVYTLTAEGGMTLRDWFAGQAIPALAHVWVSGEVDDYPPQHFARDAYQLADAMLKAREAKS